ncbi:MAG TPA: pilus assembly protein TadG-related protein [Acidimicrobiales bacterium]
MSGRRQAKQLFRRDRDERGAILVLSTVGVVLAMIFSAMAVDLGFTAHEARRNQKVADLAALDAVRDLANHQAIASQSANVRNKFSTAPGNTVVSVRGTWNGTTFVPNPAGEDVEVTVTSPHKDLFPFVAGATSVTRRAIANLQERASFDLGSKLASLNPGDNTLLNRVFTAILGTSPDLNMNLVSYQGMANGTVSLAEIAAADVGLGTAQQLATSNVELKRLATATLKALQNKAAGGDLAALAAATALGTFATNIPSNLHVNMGTILGLNAPDDPSALSAQIGVFNLISTGGQAAQIANGNNFLNIPNLTLGIPGLTSSTLRLHLIETPRIALPGPARVVPIDPVNFPTGWQTWAKTAQIGLELTTKITIGCTGLLALTCVQVDLPIVVEGAKAFGSLTDIRCAAPNKYNDILVSTLATQASAAIKATVKLLGITLPLPPIANASVPLGGGSTTLTFQNKPPVPGPEYPTDIQSTAATGLGLATLLTSQLNLLGIPLGNLLSLLEPVTTALDNQLLKPLFDSLGLTVGGADVRTLSVDCGTPTLIH